MWDEYTPLVELFTEYIVLRFVVVFLVAFFIEHHMMIRRPVG
jgi:hypothetical protein